MKTKFINIFSIITLLFITILISGCEMPLPQSKQVLATPDNIVFDQTTYKISWDEVENATTYSIYLYQDSKCIESFEATPGFTVAFLDPGIYQVAVRAIGDLEIYSPSALSTKVTFEVKEVSSEDRIKLTTPKNIEVTYDEDTKKLQVIFDNAADYVNTTGFQVYLYENNEMLKVYTLKQSGDYIKLEDVNEGKYYVTVAAITNSLIYSNSDESTEVVELVITASTSNNGMELTGYYASASNLIGDELEDALTAIITSTHSRTTTYGELRYLLQDADEDPNNKDNIILFYCRDSIKSTWDQGTSWNREHVWPKSHGNLGESGPGADAHMLRASQPSVNSSRGNKKMGNVTSGTNYTYKGQVIATYTSSTWEPMDSVKGDVARIYFYMLVRYPNLYSSFSKVADINTMLEWNELDPVDNLEIHRNEVVAKYQGNRNPFIDYPELADYIWAIE